MDWNVSAFKYMTERLLRLSKAKVKEGVIMGRQICQLFRDNMFKNLLQSD
jgi:hypothetical protein